MAEPAPSGAAFLSAEDFERRARQRLRFDLPGDLGAPDGAFGGDGALDGRLMFQARPRLAAVLVPIVAHRSGATVLLTERTSGLRDHSGQIALPGGKIDPGDASPRAAALREAEEEIGLAPGRVTPLGYLDPYLTGTGFLVVPTVAMVEAPLSLTLNPREVAAAFEVPLPFLMDPANHQRHERTLGGRARRFYAMPFAERFIWGATAGMIRNLYEKLYG